MPTAPGSRLGQTETRSTTSIVPLTSGFALASWLVGRGGLPANVGGDHTSDLPQRQGCKNWLQPAQIRPGMQGGHALLGPQADFALDLQPIEQHAVEPRAPADAVEDDRPSPSRRSAHPMPVSANTPDRLGCFMGPAT